MRGFGYGEVKLASKPRVGRDVIDAPFRLGVELAQPPVVFGGRMDGGEFGGKALDGALRVHDFADCHAGEIELHGERLGKQAGITL